MVKFTHFLGFGKFHYTLFHNGLHIINCAGSEVSETHEELMERVKKIFCMDVLVEEGKFPTSFRNYFEMLPRIYSYSST